MTHQQVAETVARSRASVSNLLRLQDLNPDVKTLLAMRDIEMGHARALLAIDGMEQSSIAKDVARKGLSVRETEALIRKMSAPTKAAKVSRKDPDVIKLEERLTECLGAPVTIKQKAKGKGCLEISYSSLDVLDGILSKIESTDIIGLDAPLQVIEFFYDGIDSLTFNSSLLYNSRAF